MGKAHAIQKLAKSLGPNFKPPAQLTDQEASLWALSVSKEEAYATMGLKIIRVLKPNIGRPPLINLCFSERDSLGVWEDSAKALFSRPCKAKRRKEDKTRVRYGKMRRMNTNIIHMLNILT